MSFPKAYVRSFLAYYKTDSNVTLIERIPQESADDLQTALVFATRRANEQKWHLIKVAEE